MTHTYTNTPLCTHTHAVNFVCGVMESELRPQEGSETLRVFAILDYCFVIIFTLELMLVELLKSQLNMGWLRLVGSTKI